MAESHKTGSNVGTHREFSENIAKGVRGHKEAILEKMNAVECMADMVDQVEGFNYEFQDEVETASTNKSGYEANKLFLKKLEMTKDSKKWQHFISALDTHGFHWLVKLISGKPTNTHADYHSKLLRGKITELQDTIRINEVLPSLTSSKCIRWKDSEEIGQLVNNKGKIAGTAALLKIVDRFKDDWFDLFMSALHTTKHLSVMMMLDEDYTKDFLKKQGENLAYEVKFTERPDVDNECADITSRDWISGDCFEKDKGFHIPNDEMAVDVARGKSPTLAEPKPFRPEAFQQELIDVVSGGENCLIISPDKSGHMFCMMQMIKDHFARDESRRAIVGFELIAKAERFLRRCCVFLSDYTATSLKISDQDPVDCRIVVFIWDLNMNVNLKNFSLLILELKEEYFEAIEKGYLAIPFKNALKNYKSMDTEYPQLVVSSCCLSASPELFFQENQMMSLCGEFQIQKTAMVVKQEASLCKFLSDIPKIETVMLGDRSEELVGSTIQSLMDATEQLLKTRHREIIQSYPDHLIAQLNKLSTPPEARGSINYLAWIKTNLNTLKGHGDLWGFKQIFSVLQTLQNAAFINSEARSIDAVEFLKKCISEVDESLKKDFKEKVSKMERFANDHTDNPVADTLKEKIVELFNNRGGKGLVVMRNPNAIMLLTKWLKADDRLKSAYIVEFIGHKQGRIKVRELFDKGKTDIFITTDCLLKYHFGQCDHWDYVIRADYNLPKNSITIWMRDPKTRRGRFPSSKDEVLLALDSGIEKIVRDLSNLQNMQPDHYKLKLYDQQVIDTQKAEFWHPFVEQNKDARLYCRSCGAFVCNVTSIRRLDDMYLIIDEAVVHRLELIHHPEPIIFSTGYSKLGRFVCKNCGEKWGIVAYVFSRPYLALAKDGVDIFKENHWDKYVPKWSKTSITPTLQLFFYPYDAPRSLPLSLHIEGQSIQDLLKQVSIKPGQRMLGVSDIGL